jgi:hypothetical protein
MIRYSGWQFGCVARRRRARAWSGPPLLRAVASAPVAAVRRKNRRKSCSASTHCRTNTSSCARAAEEKRVSAGTSCGGAVAASWKQETPSRACFTIHASFPQPQWCTTNASCLAAPQQRQAGSTAAARRQHACTIDVAYSRCGRHQSGARRSSSQHALHRPRAEAAKYARTTCYGWRVMNRRARIGPPY